ncbi:RAM signaling network component [Amphichorda felina]
MDLPDRLPTASAPPTTRSKSENIMSGRRPVPNSAATSNGPTSTPSIPTLRKAASSSNLSTSNGLPPSQVISLARDAMRNALESENQVAEAGAVGASLKPGVTVDLSRKNIEVIPDEVVDILKNELERLALSHNQIASLPARFSECTSLRYLNIRANQISEFPMPLCDLKSLEILDLGRNQLQVLPPDIARLTSLKVLSVRKNNIRELPLCLADMGSLQVLKFEGNPLVFPSKDIIRPQVSSPPNETSSRDTEVNEVAVTAQIKKYLKQVSLTGRFEAEAQAGYESSETTETPRPPLKRRVSGRFPIKVSGTELPDFRTPSLGRAPPIPQRSHYRGLSQQSTTVRRPGVMPLTLGNANERHRSNSETIVRSERAESRSRRMGVVSKKGSDLGTLDEAEASNRLSHYRGLSHGSAMQGAPMGPPEPGTPTEQYPPRPVYVRRLSILPERRRESQVYDPIIEAAKGILYSVFQIHPMIQMLMSLTGSAKRSSLEIVFYNTNSHVEELERELQKHDMALAKDDEQSSRDNENVHRACQTLVSAYGHVCTLLADNIDTFVDNGDPRYIRTLLMLIYNTNLRVATHMPVSDSFTNGAGQSGMMASGTPRSGESFASVVSRDVRSDTSEDDACFDRIYLSLQRSVDIVLRTLPNFQVQLTGGLRNAIQKGAPSGLLREWKNLIGMCSNTINQTERIRSKLSMIKLKEPGARSQGFWNLCSNFIASWAEMAQKIRSAINNLPLPLDTRMRLKPIQQSMKQTSAAITQSPWNHLFCPPESGANGHRPNGSYPMSPTQVSITPQSAALGPAMQATVPKTPQNTSFAAAFQGNVFDRADALMANPGISMSRPGMPRKGHSNLSSFSSISSLSSEGGNGPSSNTSPNAGMGPGKPRNNGGRSAF